jgi:peptidoglycan/xylan/chitin deacetylase (PgdA/CDA1 family)
MLKQMASFPISKQRLAALFGAAVLVLSASATLFSANLAKADTSLAASPKISFTFDDGLASSYLKAAPTLQKYGLTGTNYVIANCVGMTTAPNTCNADKNGIYMTWDQVVALQNTYGWEIGSHTATHGCMASTSAVDPDDCANATPLTTAQLETELHGSQQTLTAHGLKVTDLAWPFGDYGNASLAIAAKYYESTRGFADDDANNVFPYSDLVLHDQQFQAGAPTREWALCKDMTVIGAKSCIDNAITNNQWVILVFHNIADLPNAADDSYDESTADLDAIAAYAAQKQAAGQAKVVNPNQALVTGTNLLPNGDFTTGLTGWTTDSANITADAGSNGRYPEATHAVSLKGNADGTDAHLYSPTLPVISGQTYVLKNYLNVKSGTSVNFYIDEFDANGVQLTGVDPKAGVGYIDCAVTVKCIDVADVNFTYTPSSATVASARLQVIVKGAATQAYFDNSLWYGASATAAKVGDVNKSGVVNDDDATLMFANWGKTGTSLVGDVNNNGVVNDDDATLMFANWSK